MVEPESTPSGKSRDGKGSSTAATGPAGAHFEGQIAAFYLLAMLSGAPPRGLPGTLIERVALQQANTGRPLDDVIVHAIDDSGIPAVLEIQVKRTISFSPTDAIFRKVVGQIAEATRRPDFWSTRYEMAIATARGSRKIDGAYQDVLALARQLGDAKTFEAQLKLAGAANDDMRTFVGTFQSHLRDEGSPYDSETTWKLLRRLQILTFDFSAPGSASEDLARERALRILHADDTPQVDALWRCLIELAIDVAKSGGDKTRSALLEALTPLGFRIVGDRRHAKARQALAEDARLALTDIVNRVGSVVLRRLERIEAVREAFNDGRYVEIRGEAGVGKSGVLRHIAESFQTEGNVLVLSPGRCVPRGWSALRAQLGFEGTLHELLIELANDGGAVVFLDNLDSFSIEERHTVVDILREVAQVPGLSVLATARPDFGTDEPSWLPSDALACLGQAAPVSMDNLSKAEIEQLKADDPTLSPLLNENHPASSVTRNLFRLARLASQPATEPLPRSEIEMAIQWWSTADGQRDSGWRDRSRLIHALAQQAFSTHEALDVTTHTAQPIDALVASGTLRNVGIDRVTFRHDVLREWAIANAVHENIEVVRNLPLERPAPSILARGVELGARMAIECASDGIAWQKLLERLSGAKAHKSWRRAVLLALARSEAAGVILQRAQPILFGDHAGLVRELIRTVMAVDAVPASKAFASAGLDLSFISPGLNVPRGPAWLNLVMWLLSIGDATPAEAIPEVVDLYIGFSVATLGMTTITALTTKQLYGWLRQFEPQTSSYEPRADLKRWELLDHNQIQSLREDLRMGFVLFAHTTPELASEYLQEVAQSEHNHDLIRSIFKVRGSLAKAAPAELASLTAQALIEKPRPRRDRFGEMEEAFTYHDSEFLPASPAQGPFFDLLINAPKEGLALIQCLVSHAVAHGSRGRDAGNNVITLTHAGGERAFPWKMTYFWSRSSNHYAVTSGLMALEAWAHRRVDAGEPFKIVLADVLGPPGSCAAYLLVAVDLIISHWPKSVEAAADFLCCPELLCLDHTRQVHDHIRPMENIGMGLRRNEPRSIVSNAELNERGSRQCTLDALLANYAMTASSEQLAELTSRLSAAAERLGSPPPGADLGDPELMVLHALNLSDLTNWHEVEVELADGSIATPRRYTSPATEQNHFQALREKASERDTDFWMQTAISQALNNSSCLTREQLEAAVTWAISPMPEAAKNVEGSGDDFSQRMRDEAVLSTAMMVMRDGDPRLREKYGGWAHTLLVRAAQCDSDEAVFLFRTGLRFNPSAIGYAGLIFSLAHQKTLDDVRTLLEIAVDDHHAVAHGFGVAISVLAAVDERLSRALLRCAFNACIQPSRSRGLSEEKQSILAAKRKARCKAAVDAEMTWLAGDGPEPTWPIFPGKRHHLKRRRLRVPSNHADDNTIVSLPESAAVDNVHHQGAALWLRQLSELGDSTSTLWLHDIAQTYFPWTIDANGGGLAHHEEADHPPLEWNDVFFAMIARSIIGLASPRIMDEIIKPITQLPDRNFFDVLVNFLRCVDEVYFAGGDIPTSVAIDIRSTLADRMIASSGWQRLSTSKSSGIEMHIAPAISTLFFNNYRFGGSTNCYLYELGIESSTPFLPILDRLVQSGPSSFVALVLLNFLEVTPRIEQLDLLTRAGKIWLSTYPDFRSFWIDHGVGKRWCQIATEIYIQNTHVIQADVTALEAIESIVAELVGLGVPEATRFEEMLSNPKK